MGDFDSLSPALHSRLSAPTQADTPRFIQFPKDKDYSDTYLALEEGLKRHFDEFDIYGALGGDRFSHSLANIQTLCALKNKKVNATIIGKNEILYLLQNETLTLTLPPMTTFSVFSLSKESKGVTITGAKYNLENATLTNDFPLGLSNKTIGENTSITTGKGYLLVIIESSKN